MSHARVFAAFLLTAGPAAAVLAQSVPEGVHSLANAPETICGITAASALEFRSKVERSGLQRQDVGSRFDAFASDMTDEGMVQWAFTRPGEAAYPAATCRHVFKTRDGSWMSERKMRCDASRAACDSLFIAFQQVDEQTRQALLQGRR